VVRLGDIALILSALDLDDIETMVWEPYHRKGAGRPPRNPVGIFKALVVKRLRQIPSDRELYRRLWDDLALRDICDIEDRERPYHPSQLTRFRRRVGPERLEEIVKDMVGKLVEGGVIDGETVAMDATFIEAYSKRDPHDDRRGFSDPDARVGRDDRGYDLGYRAHIAADADSDLPVAFIVASANENEKRHAPDLLDKTVEATKGRVRRLVADPQYSSRRFREKAAGCGVEAVIPYPRNQRRGEDVLRVDRRFRAHGPEHEVKVYGRARSSIERVNSRLEDLVCLNRHRLRGLRNIAVHTALCVITMLLVAVAALRLGVPERARCIASFGWR
jgi:transposase